MLDTSIVSELIRNPASPVGERSRRIASISVSIVVAAELRFGCAKKASPKLTRRVEDFLSNVPVVPFDVPADRRYGEIRAYLEKTGQMIGANDLLIAAHASALDATLVTANVGEFQRIRGLHVENWLS